jgi:hypothetical protein
MIFLFLLLPLISFAEEGFELQVNPGVYRPGEFKKGQKKKVVPMPEQKSLIPGKEKREAAFAKVEGLEKEISDFDHLSRDLLYVRAKTLKPEEVRKFYPQIPAALLSRLADVLKKNP